MLGAFVCVVCSVLCANSATPRLNRCRRLSSSGHRADYNVAYLRVHSFASSLYLVRSVLYTCAISGTNGSSGFGSVNNEQMLKSTLEIVSAGDHCSFKMSKQIDPCEFTFG